MIVEDHSRNAEVSYSTKGVRVCAILRDDYCIIVVIYYFFQAPSLLLYIYTPVDFYICEVHASTPLLCLVIVPKVFL